MSQEVEARPDSGEQGSERSTFDRELLLRLTEVTRPHSYADISRMTGFHRETCRRYLTLGNPTVEFMTVLCEVLGVSIHWLLLGTGPACRDDVAGAWLRTVDPADLLLEIGLRWRELHRALADVQARVSRLERAVGGVIEGKE